MSPEFFKTTLAKWLVFIFILFSLGHPFIMSEGMTLNQEKVYFAGGCFWCMEPVFDVIPGVTDTVRLTAGHQLFPSGLISISMSTVPDKLLSAVTDKT